MDIAIFRSFTVQKHFEEPCVKTGPSHACLQAYKHGQLRALMAMTNPDQNLSQVNYVDSIHQAWFNYGFETEKRDRREYVQHVRRLL